MMVALIEAIVVALSIAAIQSLDTSTSVVGIVLAVFALIVTAGALRSRWGVLFGWLTQGYVIVVSFQNFALFALALIFGAIWWWAYRLGKQIDNQRPSP